MTGARIAFAVRNDVGATVLMDQWGDLLSTAEISILPMNLNLTAWIQLVRLIDCGAHYIPVSVLKSMTHHDADHTSSDILQRAAAERGGPHKRRSVQSTREGIAALTPREHEVLKLVAAGCPNKIIANDLCVSAHTVKLHLQRIMGKLHVSNRTEAAICFHSMKQ
jgi:DNA-binding NarL/FixJ family response regulator